MRIRQLFLLVIFLSACVGQAETATLENSVVPLSQTPTPAENFTSPPPPTATLVLPQDNASAYQFKPLSEEEYQYIFDAISYKIEDERFDGDFQEIPSYLVSFQSEYLLRFPNSNNREEIEWNIAVQTANVDNSKSQPNIISLEKYLLDMFSQGWSLDEIDEGLRSHNILLADSFEAHNLTGNGEKAFVILVRIPDDLGSIATFVISLNNEIYKIEKIKGWDFSVAPLISVYYDIFDIQDTNNNGLNEILIQEDFGSSGSFGGHATSIHHVEWSSLEKEFVVEEYPIIAQHCNDILDGPCVSEWEFSKINFVPVLKTSGYVYTRKACPNLMFQRLSYWEGKKYLIGDLEIIAPEKTLPPECLLAWAESASAIDRLDSTFSNEKKFNSNNDVVFHFENSLKNWSKGIDDIWGPASQDYVKLKLGIMYDQRGEDEKAIAVLQEIIRKPYSLEYDFISQMANLYLEIRARFGEAQACVQVKDAFIEDFQKNVVEPSIYDSDKYRLKIWGVVDWKGNLCDEKEMLKSEIENKKFYNEASLINFLKNSKIDIYHTETTDFNDNGTTDLLAFFNINDSPVIWVFYSTLDGYVVQDTNIDVWGDDTYFKMMDFSNSTSQKIFLLSADDWVRVINILPSGEIKILFEEYDGVKSLGVSQSQDSIRVIINIEDYWGEKRTSIYEWNILEKNFVLTPSVFEIAQKRLEENLYVENNYLKVIDIVEEFLPNAPAEPVDWYSCSANSGCIYSQPFYIPYFRYLQGLSYEQLGDFDKARDIYYQLWNDYPDNVFGVVASMKLELVK